MIELTHALKGSGNLITYPMSLAASYDSHGDHLVALAW
jgi:hypothetical protein